MNRETQCRRLLSLLEGGRWIGLPEIMDLRLASHTRRLHELRKQGHIIQIDDQWVSGRRQVRYRLLRPAEQGALFQ
jgi:hypothetical protein